MHRLIATKTHLDQYHVLCLGLICLTFVESFCLSHRFDWGLTDAVVAPILLVFAALKFIAIVRWYMTTSADPGWPRKLLASSFVLVGILGAAGFLLMLENATKT